VIIEIENNDWELGDIADFFGLDNEYWGKVVIFAITEIGDIEKSKKYGVTFVSDERFSKAPLDHYKVGDKFESANRYLRKPNHHLREQVQDLRPVIREVVQEELSGQLKRIYGG
jgi:hypothetical protein